MFESISMYDFLNVIVCACMVCESLKVHSTPTTKFVDQIAKAIVEGEWQFVMCYQQFQLAELFCHLGNKVAIM